MRLARVLVVVVLSSVPRQLDAQTPATDLAALKRDVEELQRSFERLKNEATRSQELLADVARDVPVGTVIASALDWAAFQSVAQNNVRNPGGLSWSPRYSKWAPADGRAIPESSLARLSTRPNAPDLRGVFVRGLNRFDPEESQAVPADRSDPEPREVGSFEGEGFKAHSHAGTTGADNPDHTHTFVGYRFGADGGGQPTQTLGIPWNGFSGTTTGASTRHQHPIAPDGGLETRPKNVALYYYIRIN